MRLAAHFVAVFALAAPGPQIYSMAWRPDGAVIALGGYKETRIVDAASRKPVATLSGHADAVRALAFSRDGKWLAAAGGLPARAGASLRTSNLAGSPGGPSSPAWRSHSPITG